MAIKKPASKKVDKLEKQFMDSKFPPKGTKKTAPVTGAIPKGKMKKKGM